MTTLCDDCGGERSYVRSRFQIAYPGGSFLGEEVPALRCTACGRTDPAPHVRRQLDAVIELVQEVPAAARKEFSSVPLHPDDSGT